MRSEYLVDTAWLEEHLDDARVRVFDCTVGIDFSPEEGLRFESGRPGYLEAHIPGAGFLDVILELSDPTRPNSFVLPSEERFEAAMSRHGVSNDSKVVLYSSQSYQWATRVWWLLRVFGFENVAVLDGGGQKWAREGRPMSKELPQFPSGDFKVKLRPDLVADTDRVTGAIDSGNACVVNALSPEMYAGTSPLDFGRKGHITGSVNLWMRELIDPETNVFLDRSTIEERCRAVGALQADACITYCGKGVSATATAFGLALVGHPVAVYDGSMEEWAADPSLPMTLGSVAR